MVATAKTRFPEAIDAQDSHLDIWDTFATDALGWARQYAREKPFTFAFWSFGIGFLLGSKLKPW